MRLQVLDIPDVSAMQLCCGCGACAAIEPERFEMVDDEQYGRRPVIRIGAEAIGVGEAMRVCPGVALEHDESSWDPAIRKDLRAGWGPVIEVWEGYAADPAIRMAGSSGGATTALALHALERQGMHGVLHTVARPDEPWLNETKLSQSRSALLAGTGSRYAPASPCDGLGLIEQAPGPCVFIGKPCDATAAQRARQLRPALDEKLGLVIAFFCAGVPSTAGTLALLHEAGVDDVSSITGLRYRGNGWPGRWTVRFTGDDGSAQERSMSYEESWGFLQQYRQWRCYICPDHTGEFADVSVGDPWYRTVEEGDAGRSLIVARTTKGRQTVLDAAAAGYIVLERSDASLLPRSQPNLLKARGRLWGQLLILRLLGAPVPRFVGFPTWGFWLRGLTIREKVSSTLGTARRVWRKGLRRPISSSVRPPDEASTSPEPTAT